MEDKKPSRFQAYLVLLTGGFLFISGLAAAGGYLSLPLLEFFGEEILVSELSVIGALFLGLGGGSAALVHGYRSLKGKPSAPVVLPPFYLFYIAFALVLGVGNLLLVGGDPAGGAFLPEETVRLIFPIAFVLGASLPALAVLSFAFRRMELPITWRQGMLMFVSGGTLSIIVTLVLGNILPYIFYLLVEPLGYLAEEVLYVFNPGGPEFFERLFFSPLLLFYLLSIAFQAPLPEEFAKALGPAWMGWRVKNERQAFALGLAAGAGFAVLENMRYQGLFAQFYGWSWGGVTALRGIGAVDHLLWTGIVSLAWFRERERKPGWFKRLSKAYLLSVGLHTLWNGGYMALLYLIGLDFYAGAGPSFSIYGEYFEISLIVCLVAMTLGMWWLLRRYVNQLSSGVQITLMPAVFSKRALAWWAFACTMVIIPVGAAMGAAWEEIRMVFFSR